MAPQPHRAPGAPPRRRTGVVLCGLRLLVGLGLLCTVVTFDLLTVVTLVGMALVMAVSAGFADPAGHLTRPFGTRTWLGGAVARAAALLAGFGVLAAAGPGVFAWWLLLAAGCWYSLTTRPPGPGWDAGPVLASDAAGPPVPLSWAAPAPVAPRSTGAPTGDPVEVSTLSDGELCRSWRASYVSLQAATDAAGLDRLARVRQVHLDELQRRHPAAFAAWLRAGARAASDPARYLYASDPVHRRPDVAQEAEPAPGTDDAGRRHLTAGEDPAA